MGSKSILVVIDLKPKFNISVISDSTIFDIKNVIKNYFKQNNLDLTRYDFQFNINKNTELCVMSTRQYDNRKIETIFKQMDKAMILITKISTGYQNLPKDMQINIALKMDLPEILSLCQTNSDIYEIICNNDKFWYSKLLIDFKTDKKYIPNKYTPKKYYQHLTNISNDYPELESDELIGDGAITNDTDLINIGINLLENEPIDSYYLKMALESNNYEAFKYLLERGSKIDIDSYYLKTALELNNYEAFKHLLERGSKIDISREDIQNIVNDLFHSILISLEHNKAAKRLNKFINLINKYTNYKLEKMLLLEQM